VTLIDTAAPADSAPVVEETLSPAEEVARDKKGSLLPVIRVIPPEAYENPTWKGLAYFGRDVVMWAAIVAGLVLIDNPLVTLGLWVLAALVISGLFIVGHDAAHEALFSSKRMNSIIGHLAMLPSWHVYEGWVLGHNRIHHGYTVREGFDFVWHPYTVDQWGEMSAFKKARHRLEWSWMGAGAYYLREVWWHKMLVGKPPARWVSAIRRDRFIILGWMVSTSIALGAVGWVRSGTVLGALWMIVKVSVVPFLAFNFVIGSFVHVHHVQPDIRWYKKREWTKFKGQMEGTTVLRAPKGLNFFIHWIMVHVPHHVDMRIPMYHLELATDAISEAFPGVIHDDKLRFRDFVRNTRICKLYDFEQSRWVSYAEADRRLATATSAPDPG